MSNEFSENGNTPGRNPDPTREWIISPTPRCRIEPFRFLMFLFIYSPVYVLISIDHSKLITAHCNGYICVLYNYVSLLYLLYAYFTLLYFYLLSQVTTSIVICLWLFFFFSQMAFGLFRIRINFETFKHTVALLDRKNSAEDLHPCLEWDSNPGSLCYSYRRPYYQPLWPFDRNINCRLINFRLTVFAHGAHPLHRTRD
jgi:hypothetical protein